MEGQRNSNESFFVLMKKALQGIFQNPISVKFDNERAYQSYIARILQRLEDVAQEIRRFREDGIGASQSTLINLEGSDVFNSLIEQINEVKTQLQAIPPYFSKLDETMKELADKEMVVNVPPFPKPPSIQRIEGQVKVINQRDPDQSQIVAGLESVKTAIGRLKFSIPEIKVPNIEVPKSPDVVFPEGKKILESLQAVEKAVKNIKTPEVQFPDKINVGNFPPQKYPNPVTNININPLRGEVKTTSVTVGTTRLPLPGEVLAYRRGVVLYNNGSVTIYVGGANVTASDGMPVPAGTFSPPIEAGPKMILYGIAASGSSDMRVMEVSNENIGG